MKSSIIDVPRKPSQADLFGIQVYQDALIKYIRLTDTPITIALQGEWGSGKTSLMNQLRYNLCDQEGVPYFAVWINTWQFSLMKTPQQAIISILEGIINQIGQLNPNKHKWEESKRKIGGVFKKMATIGTKVAAGVVGVEGDVVADYVRAHPDLTHEQLKAAFPIKKNMDVIFMDFERYQAIKAEKGKVEFFGNRTMDDTIRLADKNILICSNWPTTSQGKPAEFSKFIDVARARHGIRIEPCQG